MAAFEGCRTLERDYAAILDGAKSIVITFTVMVNSFSLLLHFTSQIQVTPMLYSLSGGGGIRNLVFVISVIRQRTNQRSIRESNPFLCRDRAILLPVHQ